MAMSRTGKIIIVISGILIVLFLCIVIGLGILFAAIGGQPTIANNSVLVLDIKGALPDYVPEDALRRLLNQDDASLSNLLMQLKKAKADKRIGGVLLQIDLTEIGWGKADEIRDAIADFKSSGKPIYAYMEFGTNKEYYIATACDHISVAPSGDLFINGLATEVTFFRGSLDKLGIYPDFYQIGRYKNAPDQLIRKQMSDAHKEVVNAMLDDVFVRYVNAIAKTRNKSPEDVKTFIDNAPIGASQALSLGLIDGAQYKDQVENDLKKRLGYAENDHLSITRSSDYRKVTPESVGLNKGERIAVIYASGAIGSGKSTNSPFGGESIGSETLVKAIEEARDDKSIRAIILRVDSPGGTVYASDMIWHAFEQAKQKKPVIVSMSDVAASGGYYISCNANKIVAEPSTITGSIGVFAGKPVLKGFYDWLGISNEYVLRGKNAGIFRETEQFTAHERAKFEQMLNSFYYDGFVPKVASGRGRDAEYINSIAQGRVWSGAQAKEKGLVDEFGGLDRAIEIAKAAANIPSGKDIHRVILPHPHGILENLFANDEESLASERERAFVQALPIDIRNALKYGSVLDHMQRGEMMAMMPFDLKIK